MSIRFEKTANPDNPFDVSNITMELPDEPSLPTILEEFECFLRACGFVFDGALDIVQEDLSDTSTV